jgi:hypothetical protein
MRPGGRASVPADAWEPAQHRIGWTRVSTGRPPVTVTSDRSAEQMRDRPMDEEMQAARLGPEAFGNIFGGS